MQPTMKKHRPYTILGILTILAFAQVVAPPRGEALNQAVDYEALQQTGVIMGSGGLVVLDDRDCMVDISRFFIDFMQDESCGKCTFCRIGIKRMSEILHSLCQGTGRVDDLERLEELLGIDVTPDSTNTLEAK